MDWALFRLINGLAGRWWVADEAFRFLANEYIVPSAIVALLAAAWFGGGERGRRGVTQALLALLVANAMVKLCNYGWFRPRPFTFNEVNLLFYFPSDSSFPSNSAATVWALAGALWLRDRAGGMGRAALLLAAAMGLSRIWVGIHYPLDIVGGAAIGLVAGWLVGRHEARWRRLADGLAWLAGKVGLA